MRHIDEEAVKAVQDKRAEELFIAKNRTFILHSASKHTRKFITDSDDEWSVAMIAFSEALNSYDAGKGAFLPFADLVIGRRLQSYFRSERKFAGEMAVNPSVFEGCLEEDAEDAALQAAVRSQIASTEDHTVEDEIQAL
ncbi:MAG: RNA polymerase subunit sigma, partial [Lawsonibacter sp.]|nr:RNA polymerase subunit sigma [Lawsonibacter sp.]